VKNGLKYISQHWKRIKIITLSNVKCTSNREDDEGKQNSCAQWNHKIPKWGCFQGQQKIWPTTRAARKREDCHTRKVVLIFQWDSLKNQANLIETGTAVSIKTIQHRFSLEFGLKSVRYSENYACHGRWRRNVWKTPGCQLAGHRNVEKRYVFGRVFCTALLFEDIMFGEIFWTTLRGNVHYPNRETTPCQMTWVAMSLYGQLDFISRRREPSGKVCYLII